MELKYKFFRKLAVVTLVAMAWQIIYPVTAYALTSGPSQPEVQQFTPIETSGLVNEFTGDFSYNIPLFELPGPNGGYPFNLGYQSGITMDQEASWVGLGWNLNPGAITRTVRGIPDEFRGDIIQTEEDMKEATTIGIEATGNFKVWGFDPSDAEIYEALANGGGQGNIGISIFADSYQGLGYSISSGLNVKQRLGSFAAAQMGLDFELNSQQGINLSPSIGLINTMPNGYRSNQLGTTFNSRRGLQGLSFNTASASSSTEFIRTGLTSGFLSTSSRSRHASMGINFAASSYTPYVRTPMFNSSLSGTARIGAGLAGVFPNGSLKAWMNNQGILDRNRGQKAFGYQNLASAGDGDLLDMNREGEGVFAKQMPNLPAPVLTYDIYNFVAQGTGGSFRAVRKDIPILHDPLETTITGGFHADVGAGGTHTEIGVGVNFQTSTQRLWQSYGSNQIHDDNDVNTYGAFMPEQFARKDYEDWYFQVAGESTTDPVNELDYIGGEQPKTFILEDYFAPGGGPGAKVEPFISSLANSPTSFGTSISSTQQNHPDRESRNIVIQPVRYDEIQQLDKGLAGFFDVEHYVHASGSFTPSQSTMQAYQQVLPDHHYAGMVVTQPDGMRYVFALPAVNHKTVEVQFSFDGSNESCGGLVDVPLDAGELDYEVAHTNKYLKRTETPAYAYAYQLTAVVGSDYVDADDIPGPSEGDFGYWVKFNYVKTSDNYKWRAPFAQANYIEGHKSVFTDDQASYMYGEKEIWYLASAETKTHIAEFNLSERMDGRGAEDEYQNLTAQISDFQGDAQYKLDKASLYSRGERLTLGSSADPIIEAHLGYTYKLCKGIPNSANYYLDPANSGKLTLERIWFNGEKSTRGALNPTVFDYHQNDAAQNPDYNYFNQDHFGVYADQTDICSRIHMPYTDQTATRADLDTNAAAWSLKEISLPSGGKMAIQYEADDYAYVQNLHAERLFEVTGMGYGLDKQIGGEFLHGGFAGSNQYDPLNPQHRKVYFQPETPVSTQADMDKYFRNNTEVYIKAKMNLKRPNHLVSEYVTGYYPYESYGIDANGPYVVLARPSNPDWEDYPPISLMAWHYLRNQLNQLINVPGYSHSNLDGITQGSSKTAIRQQWKALASVAVELVSIFRNYYSGAFNKQWADRVELSETWIRLSEPDQIKVGGGHRVKQITLSDEWDTQTSGSAEKLITGVVYDYSTEENGNIISSGVAAYEPLIGGEEIPHHQAKAFPEHILLKTPQRHAFELPVNEAYMPAPVIGYRKVTARSLTTKEVQDGVLSATIPTTGLAVKEFYTAKDFPVIMNETPVRIRKQWLPLPLYPIGGFFYDNLTGSQGYSVVLNNMHGMQKSVQNYGLDENGAIIPEPLSWVRYNYAKTTVNPGTPREYFKVQNVVRALNYEYDKNDLTQADIETVKLGTDYEFFVDMREYEDLSGSVALTFNQDYAGVLTIVPFPNVNYTSSQVRSVVTNKIMSKTGVLESVEAWNEGSYVRTDNKLYDAQTGRVLLTTVTNDYDDPVYSYQSPAFWAYPGAGPAYLNTGVKYDALLSAEGAGLYTATGQFPGGAGLDLLAPGDEIVVLDAVGGSQVGKYYLYYQGFDKSNGKYLFYSESSFASGNYTLKVVRSGRRNHLLSSSQSIIALKDPTINRDWLECYRDISNPGVVEETINQGTQTVSGTEAKPCVEDLVIAFNEVIQSGVSTHYYDCGCGSSALFYDSQKGTFEVPGCNCSYLIFDDNGVLIPYNDISAISNAVYNGNGPAILPPGGQPYQSISFNVDLAAGGSITGYLFGTSNNCPSLTQSFSYTIPDWTTTYTGGENPYLITDTLFLIDSVLSYTAGTMGQAWATDFSQVRFPQGNAATQLQRLESLAPHASGELGIWRAKGSYVYVADREQSQDLDLSKDGTFSRVPMFNHRSLTQSACAPNWRHVSEVTGYNPYSYESENRDVLDIHSAAIYSYNGKLPVAVAGNAKRTEIGFEGFEEYPVNATIDQFAQSTGNLTFYNQFNTGGLPPASREYVEINWALNGGLNLSNTPGLPIATGDPVYGELYTHGTLFLENQYNAEDQEYGAGSSGSYLAIAGQPFFHDRDQFFYAGRVAQEAPQIGVLSGVSSLSAVSFTDEKAHTGQHSLKITGTATWPQNDLILEPGKDYVLQAWVSRENTDVPTYGTFQNGGPLIRIEFYDANASALGQAYLTQPGGHIVEGWQKYEAEFFVPANAVSVSLSLLSGNIDGTPVASYFDDIRLQPVKSQMACYVYDTGDYRLRATLDDDNFATIYHYDEAGALYLVQKETLEGLRTLQESRGFLYEQP